MERSKHWALVALHAYENDERASRFCLLMVRQLAEGREGHAEMWRHAADFVLFFAAVRSDVSTVREG